MTEQDGPTIDEAVLDGVLESVGGDSGFVKVGSAGFKTRQAGRLFVFAPPTGGSWQLRGVVTFELKIGTAMKSVTPPRRARSA